MEWSSKNINKPTKIKRSRETSLWNWLKTAAGKLGKDADVQRIEDSTKTGTPDVEGCILGSCFWCELKVAYPRANGKVKVEITTAQVRRARKRCRAGGRSHVLVRVDGLTKAQTRHFLVSGLEAKQLLEPIAISDLEKISLCDGSANAPSILELMAV